MESNELKVGNLIHQRSSAGNLEVFKILNGETIDQVTHAENREQYTAIPINAAWLVKLGFELHVEPDGHTLYQLDRYYYDIDHQMLYYMDDYKADDAPQGKDKILIAFGEKSLYVHQLQNRWYSMLNKELTV